MLEIKVQLWGLKYHSLPIEKKREEGQPVATNDVGENLEGDKVNFDLPSRFEEHKEQQDEHDEGTCESFIILDSPQNFELEQVGPSLPSNGACHDNQKADWNLPPTFDEQELQVFKLEPCGVVEEFEPPLPQKESLHSQQELRTILFEERENDVYFQGVHFHSPDSTPWEASSMQTLPWPYSFWTLLFEFHDKRHVMEFYLARKELKQSNGAIETLPRNKSVLCTFWTKFL
uniref:Uncharacterized protein n=1 Tax=Opuntia streptacantha TaxID=393608 RepID=A0A7C9A8Q5_OPUST